MFRKTFVCLCRQTISRTYAIFNTVHAMSDINTIYQFQDIRRIFTRVRAWTNGRTDRQTECINTFQLCWKVLLRNKSKFKGYIYIFIIHNLGKFQINKCKLNLSIIHTSFCFIFFFTDTE